jgi:hypothetical protein
MYVRWCLQVINLLWSLYFCAVTWCMFQQATVSKSNDIQYVARKKYSRNSASFQLYYFWVANCVCVFVCLHAHSMILHFLCVLVTGENAAVLCFCEFWRRCIRCIFIFYSTMYTAKPARRGSWREDTCLERTVWLDIWLCQTIPLWRGQFCNWVGHVPKVSSLQRFYCTCLSHVVLCVLSLWSNLKIFTQNIRWMLFREFVLNELVCILQFFFFFFFNTER